MICAHPPSRKILDPVARPLYCRMAAWRSFTSEGIVIASSVGDQIRSVLRFPPPNNFRVFKSVLEFL